MKPKNQYPKPRKVTNENLVSCVRILLFVFSAMCRQIRTEDTILHISMSVPILYEVAQQVTCKASEGFTM
jgi:hypothetical protein